MLAPHAAYSRRVIGTIGRKRLSEILARYPAKVLGRAADVSPDVARRWREGSRNPSADNLLELAAAFPDVLEHVLERLGSHTPNNTNQLDFDFMAGQPAYDVNQYLQSQREK